MMMVVVMMVVVIMCSDIVKLYFSIYFSQNSVLSCFSPSSTPFEQVLTSIISVKNYALLPLGFSCHHNEFMLFYFDNCQQRYLIFGFSLVMGWLKL